MNDKFDELAEALAQPVGRRSAIKRFGVALGAITFTLMAATPGFGARVRNFSAKLLPVGDEQHASGAVQMTLRRGSNALLIEVSASCKGLTPDARYELWGIEPWLLDSDWYLGGNAADTRGTVRFHANTLGGSNTSYPRSFEVYRIEPTGDVLVLSRSVN